MPGVREGSGWEVTVTIKRICGDGNELSISVDLLLVLVWGSFARCWGKLDERHMGPKKKFNGHN